MPSHTSIKKPSDVESTPATIITKSSRSEKVESTGSKKHAHPDSQTNFKRSKLIFSDEKGLEESVQDDIKKLEDLLTENCISSQSADDKTSGSTSASTVTSVPITPHREKKIKAVKDAVKDEDLKTPEIDSTSQNKDAKADKKQPNPFLGQITEFSKDKLKQSHKQPKKKGPKTETERLLANRRAKMRADEDLDDETTEPVAYFSTPKSASATSPQPHSVEQQKCLKKVKKKSGSVFAELLDLFKDGKPSLKSAKESILGNNKLHIGQELAADDILSSIFTIMQQKGLMQEVEEEDQDSDSDSEWDD